MTEKLEPKIPMPDSVKEAHVRVITSKVETIAEDAPATFTRDEVDRIIELLLELTQDLNHMMLAYSTLEVIYLELAMEAQRREGIRKGLSPKENAANQLLTVLKEVLGDAIEQIEVIPVDREEGETKEEAYKRTIDQRNETSVGRSRERQMDELLKEMADSDNITLN